MVLLSLKDITRAYNSDGVETKALDGVSLDLGPGEMVALCGPSGSGKTTLLNIAGLLDRPSTGQVMFNGKSLDKFSEADLAKVRATSIGFIFQAYNLIDVLSAEENVALPLVNRNVPRKERMILAHAMLDRVGLAGLYRRVPSRLSGGQQQRVGVARALVGQPALVICDEITANLDSKTASLVLDLLREINREKGTAFLFATHDALILEYVERVVHMKDGSLLQKPELERVHD